MRRWAGNDLRLAGLGLILMGAGGCQTSQAMVLPMPVGADMATTTPPSEQSPSIPLPRPVPPRAIFENSDFVVYFATGETAINEAGRLAISRFVAYVRTGQPTRITIIGHTDTAGSAAANHRLSERRAQRVADAVITQGVPAFLIQISGAGETQLLKSSKDGVSEPLNRRVAITANF